MSRRKRYARLAFLPLLSLGLAIQGCASSGRTRRTEDAQRMLSSRIGTPVEMAPSPAVEQKVQTLLQEPLTLDKAVEVAILNNRSVQASLQEIGISEADLWESRLISNPEFEGKWRRHISGDDAGTSTEFNVVQNVTSLLSWPARGKLGGLRYEQAKQRVLHELQMFVMDVKSSYYNVQALTQSKLMLERTLDAEEAAQELALRQRAARNISKLELATQQTVYGELKLNLKRTESDLQIERERFGRLLGLGETEDSWSIQASLPDPMEGLPSAGEAERLALAQRPDLEAARREVEVVEQSLKVTRWETIPSLEAGWTFEREIDQQNLTGPIVQLGVPIFNRRQADRSRLKAQLLQSRLRLSALESNIRSEVRATLRKLASAKEVADYYRTTAIPLRRQIVRETQLHYNYMLLGVFQLLQAKQSEVAAERDYFGALRDYWTAYAELEHLVGGKLPGTVTPETESVPEKPQKDVEETPKEEHREHHH